MSDSSFAPIPFQLRQNIVPLHEEKFMLDSMLDGWSEQQSSRGLERKTAATRAKLIRRFQEFTETYPWEWTSSDLEAFSVHLLSGRRPLAKSTLRAYQTMIRMFCDYLVDDRYGWRQACSDRFGTSPRQICHDWNTVVHLVEYEGRPQRRALTYDELERFFEAADERVLRIQRAGKKGALAALRDSLIFKTTYAFGLRRAEVAGLDVPDLRSNPSAPTFGTCGVVYVRWGKGSRGSGPKRRTVLALAEYSWAVEGLLHWVKSDREHYGAAESGPLWPTERNTRVSLRYLDQRFAEIRDEVGLPPELSLHALRHTYVTNLIEWGYAERFVQDQVGHAYASTTAIYTSVGDDFKTRVVAQSLASIYGSTDDHELR
ncbi:tyrosine-type recombinase/integrase [Microbacterium sp. CH1]|uniref:tyrosine-type recombinase/integrase n=1 Tax=Microbacterium sp. CH1 TaxID=1770208 RepID=UPI001E34BBA3|nr:tyrosine-type recombinase/integrase [Microbacterium sp. CH1]